MNTKKIASAYPNASSLNVFYEFRLLFKVQIYICRAKLIFACDRQLQSLLHKKVTLNITRFLCNKFKS
jgi:hypothetical protein